MPLPRATARVAPTDDKEICASPGAGRCRHRPLRRGYKGCGEVSPSHGFAVPAPFRQGGLGDGGCGLPRALCALAMTWFFARGAGGSLRCVGEGLCPSRGRPQGSPLRRGYKRCNRRAGARVAPTEMLVGADDPVRPGPITQHLVGQGPCALPGVREKSGSGRCRHRPLRRVTGECSTRPGGGVRAPRPTEGLQGVRWGGRPQGSPLQRGYKRCNRRAGARVAPAENTGDFGGFIKGAYRWDKPGWGGCVKSL